MMIRVISSSLHILLLPPPASTSPPPQALQSYKCIGTRYLLGRRSDDHHRTSRLLHILRSANTDEYNEEPLAPELEPAVYVSEENVISSEMAIADSKNGSGQMAIVAIAMGVSVIVALGVATQYGGVLGGTKKTDPIESPVSSIYVQKDEGTVDKPTPSVVIDPPVSEPSQDSPTLATTTEELIGSPTTSVTTDVSVPVDPVDTIKDGPKDGPVARPASKLHTWVRHKRR